MKIISKNYIFLAAIVLASIVGYIFFQKKHKEYQTITSYQECVQAGYPVTSTYPSVCRLPGKNFINPTQEEKVGTPLVKKIENRLEEFLTIPYILNGESFTLKNMTGSSTFSDLPSRVSTALTYAGISHGADINRDTIEDTALLLNSVGAHGSSTGYFYVAAALKLYTGLMGSNIIFVDKNISTSTLLFKNGMLYVRYKKDNATTTLEKRYIFEGDILKERK